MARKQIRLIVSGSIALGWLSMQIAIYIAKFGTAAFWGNVMSAPLTVFALDFLAFAMVGLLSGLLLMAFIRRGKLGRNISVVVGYGAATPIAALMATVGDLLFPIIGPIMMGCSVLAIGIVVGYGASRLCELYLHPWFSRRT